MQQISACHACHVPELRRCFLSSLPGSQSRAYRFMYVAHQCNFGAYDSGNRDGDLCLSRIGIWRKRKIEGGNVLYRTRLSISLLFVGFFFVFCFLYNNTDRRCALSFPFSFFKEKNKAGPP